ncbi:MAG: glycosyl transferase family 2 [Elusimicrobia bacterium GWC2_51_8]|nr:MAG: glycosyl transferase family 2 [Elusimicrobia bacterium GWA2_51_34]OGR60978.1 MAG: glycosyl transferase family 2 [Elusimicrobia bacterium GWC2_51_8]OGR87912.1 MAG: glycosyl transferase family 2 [Elusimicrobia bacterium GWF2_52_66]HAF96412.1 glycosyl transferase family 2 [Elusimicrobiota bacterium]HCE97119.1 glycosyl transferase family 2 [Elusimicrobiota bacterium]
MKKIIVLPAYNAEKTLKETLYSLPKGSFDDIFLVDDCSKDGTYELALKLGLKAFRHSANRGYGANQKTCYKKALSLGAEIVVMLHPDYQYDPRVIPFMTGIIESGICDAVLGNRVRTRSEALSGGMPMYKYLSNRALSVTQNLLTGQNLGEWHSGLRAYSAKFLEAINWNENSDDFSFDSQLLLEAAFKGLRIGDIPVPARYFPEASAIKFRESVKYGLQTLLALSEYLGNSCGVLHTSRYR